MDPLGNGITLAQAKKWGEWAVERYLPGKVDHNDQQVLVVGSDVIGVIKDIAAIKAEYPAIKLEDDGHILVTTHRIVQTFEHFYDRKRTVDWGPMKMRVGRTKHLNGPNHDAYGDGPNAGTRYTWVLALDPMHAATAAGCVHPYVYRGQLCVMNNEERYVNSCIKQRKLWESVTAIASVLRHTKGSAPHSAYGRFSHLSCPSCGATAFLDDEHPRIVKLPETEGPKGYNYICCSCGFKTRHGGPKTDFQGGFDPNRYVSRFALGDALPESAIGKELDNGPQSSVSVGRY